MTKNHGQGGDDEEAQCDPRELPQERGAGQTAPPLVSVVIPCYNQAHFLGEAIESVLAQTHRSFEVVVVDDGSTDGTSEVAGRYPKVRLVRQENRGLSGARNSGLAVSEGEYVVFLDADDRLLPEALEVGVERLGDRPECAFVSGHIRYIAADGSPLPSPRSPHVNAHYLALLHYNYIWMPAVVMYRRDVFGSVGGFNPSPSLRAVEDWDLYLRIARRFPTHHHGEVVAEYRRHGTNMTRDYALMLKATMAVLRSQRKHVKGNRRYEEAYRTGVSTGQEYYGVPLANAVRNHMQKREWKRALRGVLVLLRYYPQGLALLNGRRMERRRLARRLQKRKQELKIHERRLKELEGAQESESALANKERQEVQLLRRRTRGLERRMQKLDRRRAQNGRVPGVRSLLKRLGSVKARVLGK